MDRFPIRPCLASINMLRILDIYFKGLPWLASIYVLKIFDSYTKRSMKLRPISSYD